jgi:tRNA(Arg) A34 adenosine deaminase TadA
MSDPETDLRYLRRAIDLAHEAFEAGDQPFGSLLVDAVGEVRFEERNRAGNGDETRHPELDVARWSAAHLSPAERASSTVYTSGEHCPMCSAAHAWMGLGAIVYAGSTAQLVVWRAAWGLPPSPVIPLAVQEVAPGIEVRGPFIELEDELRELHRAQAERSGHGVS